MDNELYEIMKDINNTKSSDFTKDIHFLGTLTSDEVTNTGNVGITRDIFMMIDEMPDGSVVQKFYDGDKNFIAGRDKDGKLYPAAEFASEDLSFLGQLDILSNQNGISLNELDGKLDRVSKSLGIPKEKILCMSDLDLEQTISDNDGKNPKLLLDDAHENDDTVSAINQAALENISSKQDINLDNKVDDKFTLADVLGVPAGSTLHVVYSDSIANNKNTTRFSFICEYPDGSVHPADMLNQVGGKSSDKNVYEVNRDGSEVEKQHVDSSYAIDSPIIKNAILTAKIGSMGYVELGYGQVDKTSNRDVVTHELETSHTYYTTARVRKEFSRDKGSDNIVRKMDEIERHEEYGCNDLSLDEADGDLSTGHVHEIAIAQIKAFDSDISDVFTDNEINDRLQKMAKEYPNDSFAEVVERTSKDLAEDASRMRH